MSRYLTKDGVTFSERLMEIARSQIPATHPLYNSERIQRPDVRLYGRESVVKLS